jgi:hypothetical protein
MSIFGPSLKTQKTHTKKKKKRKGKEGRETEEKTEKKFQFTRIMILQRRSGQPFLGDWQLREFYNLQRIPYEFTEKQTRELK